MDITRQAGGDRDITIARDTSIDEYIARRIRRPVNRDSAGIHVAENADFPRKLRHLDGRLLLALYGIFHHLGDPHCACEGARHNNLAATQSDVAGVVAN